MSGIGLPGVPSSPLPIVEISPPDIARRRLANWGAIQADNVKVTRRETFEDGFQAQRHLLIAYERAERHDGETLIEGLPKSTLREFNCKLSFVPAGHRFYGWQTPRVLTRVTYFYIDLPDRLFDPRIRHRLSRDQPAPVLLRSSRLGHRAQAQGRGREFRPVEPRICGGLEPRADARALPTGTNGTGAARPVRGGLPAWQQKRVVEFIEEHLAEEISLAALAELVDLSLYHFARAFTQSFGAPPHRYHMARRMDRAKEPVAEASALSDANRRPDWLSRNEFVYEGISQIHRTYADRISPSPGGLVHDR
jgi:AraC family transcriptional regulator